MSRGRLSNFPLSPNLLTHLRLNLMRGVVRNHLNSPLELNHLWSTMLFPLRLVHVQNILTMMVAQSPNKGSRQ